MNERTNEGVVEGPMYDATAELQEEFENGFEDSKSLMDFIHQIYHQRQIHGSKPMGPMHFLGFDPMY